jgi:hypothetical protein
MKLNRIATTLAAAASMLALATQAHADDYWSKRAWSGGLLANAGVICNVTLWAQKGGWLVGQAANGEGSEAAAQSGAEGGKYFRDQAERVGVYAACKAVGDSLADRSIRA